MVNFGKMHERIPIEISEVWNVYWGRSNLKLILITLIYGDLPIFVDRSHRIAHVFRIENQYFMLDLKNK